MKTILVILITSLWLISCQEVIELDLEQMEKTLVIEGHICDMNEQCEIRLSFTTDYFSPGVPENVSGAEVSMMVNLENLFLFIESSPGVYTSAGVSGEEGNSYLLDILYEEETYQSEVIFPERVVIDSLSYEDLVFDLDYDEGYSVNCHFHDPSDGPNYYRMNAYSLSGDRSQTIYVFNDRYWNGNNMKMQWDDAPFQAYDSVVVELFSLDPSTYDYYRTLSGLVNSNILGSTPANPISNLSNGAMGVFAAYTICRDTIQIIP